LFPSQYEPELRRRDLQREADQDSLIKLATEGMPSFWQRVVERLPNVEITAPTVRVVVKNPREALA
jgi:hypothetical protein